jgi:nicotinamide mononucleotide transporter
MNKLLTRPHLLGMGASVLLLILSVQETWFVPLTLLEAIALIFSAWSVWLLSLNLVLGWWLGLIGVTAYAVVFYEAKLYGEVGIQVFYFITSLQAIWIWWHGGNNQTEKPVANIPSSWLKISLISGIFGIVILRSLLIELHGVAPLWDSITTVGSIIAQLLLMERYVQSWYLWIGVDTIYVPLYASRGLYFTSILYAIFWLMAVKGLINFQRLQREQNQL